MDEGVAASFEELLEGVFHDRIELAGKTLAGLSVGVFFYKKLAKLLSDRSDVAHAVQCHFAFGCERAVVATRSFQKRLNETLAQPELLPVAKLKAELHTGALTQAEKLGIWTQIRRLALAHLLVTLRLRTAFLVAAALRNAVMVVAFLEEKQGNRSTWEVLQRLRTKFGSTDKAVLTLVETLAQSMERAGEGPFDCDTSEGPLSLGNLASVLLRAAPLFVDHALIVVDATLSQAAEPLDGGKCDAEALSVILSVMKEAYSDCVPWYTVFQPFSQPPPTPPAQSQAVPSTSSQERLTKPASCDEGVDSAVGLSPSDSQLRQASVESANDSTSTSSDREGAGVLAALRLISDSSLPSTPCRSAELPLERQKTMRAYLTDLLCASDDCAALLNSAVDRLQTTAFRQCVETLAQSPPHKEGKTPCLLAVVHLEKWRQRIADELVDAPPLSVVQFGRELIKATCRGGGME